MVDWVGPDIVIRKAVVEDAGALADFAARSFRETFSSGSDPDDLEAYLVKAFSPAVQAADIGDAASTILLAFDGSSAAALVGYAHLVQHKPDVQLKRLYVDAAHKGRGLAARLLSRVFDECRQNGSGRIWLTVWTENDRAISFYRKNGFRVCGSETFMLGTDPQIDHVMDMVIP